MADTLIGGGAGIVVGTVKNRKDDPTQSGKVQVQWDNEQSQLGEGDLPWTSSVFPSTNPSMGKVGGPHTGHMEGSRVIAIRVGKDGQDKLILGSLLSAGNSSPDSYPPKFESDAPAHAKSQQNGGESQSGQVGDYNEIATTPQGGKVNQSIVTYAQEKAADQSDFPKAMKYPQLKDSIGTYQQVLGETSDS